MKAKLTNQTPSNNVVLFLLIEPWISRSMSGPVFYHMDTPYGSVKCQKLLTGVSSLYIVKEDDGYHAYQVA